MKFTFGIVTAGTTNLPKIIESIRAQQIPDEDIIVVGGSDPNMGIRHIPFDETVKKGWISRKKNLITNNARHENIVFMHDYFYLDEDWFRGFQLFGNQWDICMNMIINADGYRYRDWCIYSDPDHCYPKTGPHKHMAFVVPYFYDKTKYMYISGGYWVAKKSVMEKHLLNETLGWGEGEDVDWSNRVLKECSYKANPLSIVKMLKHKPLELTYLDI